jgi:hypothetical protein
MCCQCIANVLLMYIGLLQRRQADIVQRTYLYIHPICIYRSIAEEAGANWDIVQRLLMCC